MTPEDKRLVAVLQQVKDKADPIIDEILAGNFDQDERRALAMVLASLAGDLDPDRVLPQDCVHQPPCRSIDDNKASVTRISE